MARATQAETRLEGLPISGGMALARVCLFNENRHNNLPIYKVGGDGLAAGDSVENEKARLRQAIHLASDRIDELITQVEDRVGLAEAEIFKVHKMLMNDTSIRARIVSDIESNQVNAETAIVRTLQEYESRLLDLDDAYIIERVSDIGEVRRRLLDVLGHMNPSLQCGDQAHCQQGRNRIVVAEELTPSLTTELNRDAILGFVTERGGTTSHAAILARALRIPAVSGIKGIHGRLSCGTELLINGNTGEVIVWPSERTIRRFRASAGAALRIPEPVAPIPGLTVMANISRTADVHDAVAMRAEGVGLYRTEFEFLAAGRMLDETEQFDRYASVVQAFDGQPVYFRLLDIGGDKAAPFFGLPHEENPALGLRGSRLLLARPELLKDQARALARASAYGPIHVMYPMVIDIEQFLELKRLFNEAVAGIRAGRILHGLMFEVPSACLQARELLEAADFASIGTNDLVQYLFAVDRNNELVAYDNVPDRPILWSLLGRIARAAVENHRPLSVCGEVAGDPSFLPQLMQLGVSAVSVSPRLIPEVRLAVSAPLPAET